MTRRRIITLAVTWTAPSLLFLLITGLVYGAFRMDLPARADDATRAAAMAPLRAVLEGAAAAPAPGPALSRALPDGGPIIAVVFLDGRERARVSGRGATWGAAIAAAAEELRRHPLLASLDAQARARARIRVDAVVARGPMPEESWLLDKLALPGVAEILPLHPGVEGLGAHVNGQETVLLPADMVSERLLAKKRPVKVAADFTMGVDLVKADGILIRQAKAPAGTKPTDHYRLRTDSFVERPQAQRAQAPLQLYRDNVARPPISAAALRAAALEGGRYLVAHIGPNGRYVYEHNFASGQATDPMKGGPYSLPRHAGTTYFLAELYRLTKEEFLREPIERAFSHMSDLISQGGCDGTTPGGEAFTCVIDRGQVTAELGSTALSVVALAEYQRATGDKRYEPLARRLTAWLLWMQRPNGTFRYYYNVRTKVADEVKFAQYYAGESALAFARMHVVTGERRYADAAGKALDRLIEQYDFFLGGFFYGEEHWTCIASEAVWPAVKREEYKDFCHGYGAFLRAQQANPGDHPDQEDLAGAYNLTPFVMPFNTPAGSRTEAMLSAYLLGKHMGDPDEDVWDQNMAALSYTLGQIVRDDNAFAAAGSLRVLGGVPGSPIDRNVRIDFVQHVCSAMIRAAAIMEQ